MTKPRKFRELKAAMALKGLSLADVAKKAKVNYCTASQVLNGNLKYPHAFKKLSAAIESAQIPQEVASL